MQCGTAAPVQQAATLHSTAKMNFDPNFPYFWS